MNKFTLFLILAILPFSTAMGKNGDKPQWVTKGPSYLEQKRTNSSYHFVYISSIGNNLQELRSRRVTVLSERLTNSSQIERVQNQEATNVQGGVSYSTVTYTDKATNKQVTKRFYHKTVDEYWEWINGSCTLHTLFAVSEGDVEPRFDNFSSTTSYGASPAFMSIIPGVGQFYKGSTLKGICMLGGVAVCGLGALFCENERSDYKNKMKEQPQFAQTYNTKANNYETARNICIGAAAAVWIYNIIDAAAAKGARKIVVKPNYGSYLSIHPVATHNSAAVTLTYNF